MYKHILIHLILGISYVVGAIWGIFEGLDYIVNDDPANWDFLYPLIGGLVGAIINFIVMVKNN